MYVYVLTTYLNISKNPLFIHVYPSVLHHFFPAHRRADEALGGHVLAVVAVDVAAELCGGDFSDLADFGPCLASFPWVFLWNFWWVFWWEMWKCDGGLSLVTLW